MTFKKFEYSPRQLKIYMTSARKDFRIASKSDDPDVMFRFGYDSLIKLAIAICASENLRVLSRAGHHMELLNKLAEILKNDEIAELGNKMREKRNKDLYSGGAIFSNKEANAKIKQIKAVFEKAEIYLNKKKGKEKMF